jgi:hypothetical protein
MTKEEAMESTGLGSDAARAGNEMTEEEIDQNLADSFPASDPPSWTLGLDDHTVSDSRNEARNTA